MKITLAFEIGDRVLVKVPSGPMKFTEIVGTIEDITQPFDETNDLSSTIFVLNVNETLYNISRTQILRIATDDDHIHDYQLHCTTCGYPND